MAIVGLHARRAQCTGRRAAHRNRFVSTRTRQAARRAVAPQLVEVAGRLAEAGDVEAPSWVIFAVAAAVTVVGTAIIPLALKSGTEAADEMQQRDSRKWGGK